mmetsp:Transcript_30317/g.34435  ORF Transcript_30317/g.34435 Transcript_30317/m.34435 type:complete len:526 (+) Transcript_30317:145-1722(+)
MSLFVTFVVATLPACLYLSWSQLACFLFIPVVWSLILPWLQVLYYRLQGVPVHLANPFDIDMGWMIKKEKDMTKYQKHCTQVYGPFCFLTLMCPQMIKEVLASKAKHFKKDHPIVPLMKTFMGTGVAFAEGHLWKSERRTLLKAFSHHKLLKMSSLIEESCNNRLRQLKKLMKKADDNKHSLDWNEELMQLSLEIIGRCAFGQKYSSVMVDGKETSLTDLTRSLEFDIVKYGSSLAYFLCPKKVDWKIDQQTRDLWKKATDLKQIGRTVLQERIEEVKANPMLIEEKPDLLNLMLDAHLDDHDPSEIGKIVDNDLLVDECVTFVLAGSETTATLLTWVFYMLSQHPEVTKKLRAELTKELGDRYKEDPDHIIKDFGTLDNSLPYLDRIIRETLRLFPSLPVITPKVAEKDVVLSCGLKIRKGTMVVISPYLVQRNEHYWTNPQEFNPDRDEFEKKNDLRYMPFSAGPRGCLGQFFALMEAKIAIIKYVLSMDIVCDPSTIDRLEARISLTVRDGMPTEITPWEMA